MVWCFSLLCLRPLSNLEDILGSWGLLGVCFFAVQSRKYQPVFLKFQIGKNDLRLECVGKMTSAQKPISLPPEIRQNCDEWMFTTGGKNEWILILVTQNYFRDVITLFLSQLWNISLPCFAKGMLALFLCSQVCFHREECLKIFNEINDVFDTKSYFPGGLNTIKKIQVCNAYDMTKLTFILLLYLNVLSK